MKQRLNHLSEMELNYMELGLSPESSGHMVTRHPPLSGRILEAQSSFLQLLKRILALPIGHFAAPAHTELSCPMTINIFF